MLVSGSVLPEWIVATMVMGMQGVERAQERAIGIWLMVCCATLLALVMLGGAWVPSFVFPEWLQSVSLAIPTRWAIDGFAAMTWRGLGIEVALLNTAVLIGFSLLFTLLAMWRFEWEE